VVRVGLVYHGHCEPDLAERVRRDPETFTETLQQFAMMKREELKGAGVP